VLQTTTLRLTLLISNLHIDNYLRTGEQKNIGIGREVKAMNKEGMVFPIYLGLLVKFLTTSHLSSQ
jgi:hypothetical protein